jgi:hypothetical protein
MTINITPERLYKVGFWCFFIIFLTGLFNFFIIFEQLNIASIIGTVAQLTFNLILALFFRYMIKSSGNFTEIPEPEDIEEIIKEVKN